MLTSQTWYESGYDQPSNYVAFVLPTWIGCSDTHLDIQHVDFVDEEDSGDEFSDALVDVLVHHLKGGRRIYLGSIG